MPGKQWKQGSIKKVVQGSAGKGVLNPRVAAILQDRMASGIPVSVSERVPQQPIMHCKVRWPLRFVAPLITQHCKHVETSLHESSLYIWKQCYFGSWIKVVEQVSFRISPRPGITSFIRYCMRFTSCHNSPCFTGMPLPAEIVVYDEVGIEKCIITGAHLLV